MATRPKRRRSGELARTVRFFLLLALGIYLLRALVFQPFFIPSASMQPGLLAGDYLFVAKWPYGYGRASFPGLGGGEGRVLGGLPARGDVVVFKHPVTGIDMIKRVIGLPGDRVAVRGGGVELDGGPVPRDRVADWPLAISPNSPCRVQGERVREGQQVCRYPRYRETLRGGRSWMVLDQGSTLADDRDAVTVPPGQLLVMGDNRDDSLDGRVAREAGGVGLLPADNLVGRALLIFFSTDGSADWLKPWTWVSAARPERFGLTL